MADENKMTASNLGIIFGPTLIKPRQNDGEVSRSSLVDYPYQALTVEMLIRHYELIFDAPLSPVDESSPLPVKSRFTPQEKEQRLSRHSRSLVDIKEQHQNVKTYKRHSSVIPSIHLLEEVKEVKGSTEEKDFAPVETENMNGALSSSAPEVRNSPNLSRQTHVSRVQLRPRPKLSSRPVSMPPERLLNAQNSSTDLSKGVDLAIEEVSEEEKPKGRNSNHYKNTYIDTQTLRRTWDKQYKHYGITPRTAMIMANIHSETEESCTTVTYTSGLPGSVSQCTTNPCTDALHGDGEMVNSNRVLNAFRPPRTLKPPPGTFYKPPVNRDTTLSNKSLGDTTQADETTMTKQNVVNANSVEDEEEEEEEVVDEDEEVVDEEEFGLEVSVDEDPLHDPQLGQNQTKPVYPRLRARRMPDFENREAHFV